MVVAAAPAEARNVTFVQPFSAVMNRSQTKDVVGDLQFRFGKASAGQGQIVGADVTVEGVGRATYDGTRSRQAPSDKEVCDRALADAVTKLVTAARKAGANGVTGIVSNYKGSLYDDPQNFECHAGTFSSTVVLKGQLVRFEGKVANTLPAAASAPAQAAAAAEHVRVVPPATGFADVADASAVPLSAEGRERYRHYLTLPSPKAFVVYETGGWRFYWKDGEAMTKTLDYCAREGKRCWLYAVDDRVVWSADPAARIATSAQLANR